MNQYSGLKILANVLKTVMSFIFSTNQLINHFYAVFSVLFFHETYETRLISLVDHLMNQVTLHIKRELETTKDFLHSLVSFFFFFLPCCFDNYSLRCLWIVVNIISTRFIIVKVIYFPV